MGFVPFTREYLVDKVRRTLKQSFIASSRGCFTAEAISLTIGETAASPMRAHRSDDSLLSLPLRRAFFCEGLHAFFLVFGGEEEVEGVALVFETFGE